MHSVLRLKNNLAADREIHPDGQGVLARPMTSIHESSHPLGLAFGRY